MNNTQHIKSELTLVANGLILRSKRIVVELEKIPELASIAGTGKLPEKPFGLVPEPHVIRDDSGDTYSLLQDPANWANVLRFVRPLKTEVKLFEKPVLRGGTDSMESDWHQFLALERFGANFIPRLKLDEIVHETFTNPALSVVLQRFMRTRARYGSQLTSDECAKLLGVTTDMVNKSKKRNKLTQELGIESRWNQLAGKKEFSDYQTVVSALRKLEKAKGDGEKWLREQFGKGIKPIALIQQINAFLNKRGMANV
jgi:hypothetical protein